MIKRFNEYNSESVSTKQDIEEIISDTFAYLLDDNVNSNDEELVEARIMRIQRGSFRTNNKNVYHIYIGFNSKERLWSEIKDYVIVFLEVLTDRYELRSEFESSDITMRLRSEYGGGIFYLNSKDIISELPLPKKLIESPIDSIRLEVIK